MNAVMLRRMGGFPDWHRWFDLHSTGHITATRPDAYDWYTRQDGRRPIYRWERDDRIPGCVVYPRDAVQDWFGQDEPETDFQGSLSWMLALAMLEQVEAIDVFWCPMDDDAHRAFVPSVRYWIGRARGQGIRVTVHGDSALKPSGALYGVNL